nr:hypothetical protein [Saprospiraceae bacterium]
MIKPEEIFIPLLTVLFLLLGTQGWGQTGDHIRGVVIDSNEQIPLQGASVMLFADTVNSEVIDFTFTNQMGEFELKGAEGRDTSWIRFRHIGFQTITIPIHRGLHGELIIEMGRTVSPLREVVIESARLPILRKGDTTTYDLGSFIDSTEYTVEDILKKLPGIEVSEDGKVTVYGKPIEGLLIEGDDLFGRTYTIGTRNIRAEYISHVQIFENYEENPVLKNVSMSNSVALNLILDENMGMEFQGTIEPGGGAGVKGEGKWQLNSNIFSITGGHKMIYLGSNGNTGRGFTMNEMDLRYGGSIGNQGVRDNNIVVPRHQHFTRLVNPELPVWYVDNSRRLFNTVRSITRLGEQWRLSVNGLLHNKKGQQFRTNERNFSLRDDTYFLQTEQDHKHFNWIGDTDVHLDFMSNNQKTRLESYFKWASTSSGNNIGLRQFENNSAMELSSIIESEKSSEYFGSILLTSQAGENQVFQFQLKWSRYIRPQHLQGRNFDFPLYFNQQGNFSTLHQSLDYYQRRIEASSKYLYQLGKIGLRVNLKFEQIQSEFSNKSHLTDEIQSGNIDSIRLRNTNETVNTRILGLNVDTRLKLTSKSHIQLNFKPEIVKHQNRDTDRKSVKPSYQAIASFQKELTTRWELNLGFNSTKQPLSAYMHFLSPFFSSLYSDVNPSYQGYQFEGQSLNFSMIYRNVLQSSSGQFRATYAFGESRWSNAYDFFRTIVSSDPIYIKNSTRWSFGGSYQWFYTPIKTNIRLNSGYAESRGQSVIIGELSPTKHQNFHLRLLFESRLAHGLTGRLANTFRHFKVHTDVSGFNRRSSGKSNRTDLSLTYSERGWRMVLTGTYHTATGSGLTSSRLFGSHFKINRQITIAKKDFSMSLNVTNLTNSSSFDIISTGTEFYSRTGTRAVPLFIYLTASFTIF